MEHVKYRSFSDEIHKAVVQERDEGGERVPVDSMIELTRLCSIKCTHCYIGDARWKKDPNEMTTEQTKELLDVLAEKGTLWVCFTGGEAMIRKDFRELWLYAKEKGFILTLFTNATLINESMADFLEENPPFNLEVSIYGATEETYEKVSQVKGSYKRFMRGIENIRKREFHWILKTVVIKENSHELEQMRGLAQEWGVQFKYDANINPSIGEGKTGGKAPCATRVEIADVAELDMKDGERREEIETLVNNSSSSDRGEYLYSCSAGLDSTYIKSDGTLQMCILTGHRGHNLQNGKSILQEFEKGWDSFGEVRKIRLKEDSPCHSCDLALICENCPGFAQLENGDENSAVEFLCRSTHLKAIGLGMKHKCDPNHYVYNSVRKPKPKQDQNNAVQAQSLTGSLGKDEESGKEIKQG